MNKIMCSVTYKPCGKDTGINSWTEFYDSWREGVDKAYTLLNKVAQGNHIVVRWNGRVVADLEGMA